MKTLLQVPTHEEVLLFNEVMAISFTAFIVVSITSLIIYNSIKE